MKSLIKSLNYILLFCFILIGYNLEAQKNVNSYESDTSFYESDIAEEIRSYLDNDDLDEALQMALSIEKADDQSRAIYLVSVRYLPKEQWEKAMALNMMILDPSVQDMAFAGVAIWLSSRDMNEAIKIVHMINNPDVEEFYLKKFSR